MNTEEFKSAAEEVKRYNPDNDTKSKLYGLYKQVNFGNCNTDKPGYFSGMTERYKWDAWNNVKGKSKEDAMREYVNIVMKLRK